MEWFKRLFHICQDVDGCWRSGDKYSIDGHDELGKFFEEIHYYCMEHAHSNGFCWGCRVAWGGVESFDFNPIGLCDNCFDDSDIYDCYDWDDCQMEIMY